MLICNLAGQFESLVAPFKLSCFFHHWSIKIFLRIVLLGGVWSIASTLEPQQKLNIVRNMILFTKKNMVLKYCCFKEMKICFKFTPLLFGRQVTR